MRSYSASKVVSRLLSVLVLSGVLLGFVDSPRPAIWAQEADEGKIAYIGQDNNIWLVNADGSETRQITFDAIPGSNQWEATVGYSELRWSPDGRQLGVRREERGEVSIVVIRATDFAVTTLVSDVDGTFDWLPDSRSIVFSNVPYEAEQQGSQPGGLSVLNLNTGEVTPLINPGPDLRLMCPDWAPVGEHILFSIEPVPWPEGPWASTLGLAGASSSKYTEVHIACPTCNWSPDGERVVCGSGISEFASLQLVILSALGTELGRIPDRESYGEVRGPVWSPNGRFIAYERLPVDFAGSVLDIAEMEGNEVVSITTIQGTDDAPDWYHAFDWSPDGSRLLALHHPYGPDSNVVVIDIGTLSVIEVATGSSAAWQPAIQRADLDLGFRPDPNGYHFQNDQFLRTQEMFEQFFGTENVRHPDGSWCEAAKQFFRGTHPDMPQAWKGKGYRNVADGWSCVGFSLSSLLSYLDQPQPQAGPFAIAHYEQLYRHTEPDQFTDSIAYYSGVQTGKQYVNAWRARMDHCDTDPNRKINDIEEGILNREPVIVLLNTFTKIGYHALVPYRVESVSSTETNIYVYDSEATGEEHVIHFAHSGDEWHWTYTFLGSIATAKTPTGHCKDIFLYPVRTLLSAKLETGNSYSSFAYGGTC